MDIASENAARSFKSGIATTALQEIPTPLEAIFSGEPIYAIIDAAANPDLFARLSETKLPCASLYRGANEGASEELHLQLYGPWLVKLEKEHAFTQYLLKQGWGQTWGVYVSCGQPLASLRQHLRRFLVIESERGRKMYFRFCDPRVLRQFLPTCTPQQLEEFFGQIDAYWAESRDARSVIRFSLAAGELMKKQIPVRCS